MTALHSAQLKKVPLLIVFFCCCSRICTQLTRKRPRRDFECGSPCQYFWLWLLQQSYYLAVLLRFGHYLQTLWLWQLLVILLSVALRFDFVTPLQLFRLWKSLDVLLIVTLLEYFLIVHVILYGSPFHRSVSSFDCDLPWNVFLLWHTLTVHLHVARFSGYTPLLYFCLLHSLDMFYCGTSWHYF